MPGPIVIKTNETLRSRIKMRADNNTGYTCTSSCVLGGLGLCGYVACTGLVFAGGVSEFFVVSRKNVVLHRFIKFPPVFPHSKDLITGGVGRWVPERRPRHVQPLRLKNTSGGWVSVESCSNAMGAPTNGLPMMRGFNMYVVGDLIHTAALFCHVSAVRSPPPS